MKARACEEIKTGRNKMLQRDNAENTVTVRHCWVHTDQSTKIFILKAHRDNACTTIIYSIDDSVGKDQIALRREQYILRGDGPPEQISI